VYLFKEGKREKSETVTLGGKKKPKQGLGGLNLAGITNRVPVTGENGSLGKEGGLEEKEEIKREGGVELSRGVTLE